MIGPWEKAIGLQNNRFVKVLSGEAEKKKKFLFQDRRENSWAPKGDQEEK